MYNPDIQYIVASLEDIIIKSGYSHLVIQKTIRKAKLDRQTANLHRKVVYGVLENYLYLEAFLASLANKKVKKSLKLFMLAALYELHFLDGREKHVVVNRYVDSAKRDYQGSEKFVNAVLRRSLREKFTIDNIEKPEFISLKYSYPLWLVERWLENFGREKTLQIMEANQKVSRLYLRLNPLRANAQTLIAKLADNQVQVEQDAMIENAFLVKKMGNTPLDDWDAFVEGYCSVQDLSAILVGRLSGAKNGDKVLDLCAAPGGKSMDLAERIYPDGQLIANDKYPQKMGLIAENALRLGLQDIIKTELSDAKELKTAWKNAFDIVLLDAPCSGLGTISKNPEIKYRKSVKDILNLAKIQAELLQNAAQYVKIKGRLIYSTCTIEVTENRKIIENFLEHNKNYKLVTTEFGDMVEIFPGGRFSDGFFIAILERKKEEG